MTSLRLFAMWITMTLPILSTSAALAADSNPATELSPADTECLALIGEFRAHLDDFWQKLREFTDRDAALEFNNQHDPGVEYLPKLLEFERQHVGEDAGFNALDEIVSYAARSGDTESYRFTARREALKRMRPYEDRELAILLIERLNSGAYDPQVLDYLRRVGESADANPTLRAAAQLAYAKKILSLRAMQQQSTVLLQDHKDGMEFDHPELVDYFREFLDRLPPAAELDASVEQAIAMLKALAESGDSYKMPAYRTVDSTNCLVRIDAEKSKSNTTVSTKAAGLLFEERYLRPGQAAPDIELELIDGGTWKLADQRGRVAVIQFSFTGCGPCAAMYPDLHAMTKELSQRVSILTIMSDSTPAHALAAKESDKINWQVACDGSPGAVATRWAVDSFPTIYVIDRAGKIAAVDLRGKQLRWKVEQLLAAGDK